MNRKEAEKLVREVMANHAGEPMEDNLFKNSVDQLLKETNKLTDNTVLVNTNVSHETTVN